MSWWSTFTTRRRPKQALQPYRLSKEAPFQILTSGRAGQPVFVDWDAERAIKHGFKASTWVYASNRFIASKLSPIPWRVEQLIDTENDVWEEVPDHPAKTLLDNPNPLMSGQDLRELWFYHLGLAGNAVNVMTVVRKAPVEIWPLMPSYVRPVPSAHGELIRYEWSPPNSSKKPIDPNEVIHFKYVDPSNIYWGMSPLQAAGMVVDTDVEAVKWNKASLENRAKKDYAFFPQEALTQDQWEEAREQLDAQQGANAAGGWFLGGMPGNLHEMGMSPHDMDYIQGRVQNREEILAAYGLPEVLLTGKGILRNFETADKQFWESLAVPALDDFKEELNRSIMPFFDPNSQPKARSNGAVPQLRYNYDVSHIMALQASITDKISQAQALADLGVPLNIALQYAGIEIDPIPGGDEPRQAQATFFTDSLPANLKEEDFWDMQWKRLDTQRLEWEKQIERIIASQFDKEADALLANFQGTIASVDAAIIQNEYNWRKTMEVVYREVITFFAEQEIARLERMRAAHFGPGSSKDVVFDPFAQYVDSWVTTNAATKVSLMSQTSRNVIGGIVGVGVANNQTTDEIAREIRNTYSTWAMPADSPIGMSRSYTISRTEVGAAQNYAHMEGARQVKRETGLNVQKRWVSSRDSRVRDSHASVDGETVELEERFSNGLLHPNDPIGPAGEVVNCRCVSSNVISR